MSRIKPIDPAAATGPVRELFDGPLKGKHFNFFKSMGASYAGLKFYLDGNGALSRGGLNAKERETIAIYCGEVNGCEYCVAAHTALGLKAGLTKEQTIGARRGRIEGDARLDALVRFVGAIHEKHGDVSDDDLAAFRAAGFTDEHVVEAAANYAMNVYTNIFNHINRTPSEFPPPPPLD